MLILAMRPLTGAKFSDSRIEGEVYSAAALTGAIFADAESHGTLITGTDFTITVLDGAIIDSFVSS
ncbi:MAG: hypothetical protein FWH57_10520 [Oscillospiraceae bacterium]|nr:hypothetical protein [Oscillospiraceae bacterium]